MGFLAWVFTLVLWGAALALVLGAVVLGVCRLRPTKDLKKRRSVTVLVLGDFGRSPRMQYHCVSLAKLPFTTVDIVGYGGTDPIDEIVSGSAPNVDEANAS